MKLIILIGAVIFLGMSSLYVFQSKMVFAPTSLEKNYVFQFDVPFEEKYISYNGQQIIHGLLFKPVQPECRILYFHGNSGALDSWGYAGVELADKLKCEVLVIDYPGYGKSSGGLPTSERALYESAEAALKDLISGAQSKLPIILYGRSLGSAVASYLAAKNDVQALILETPYLSVNAMAAVVAPILPSFLVRYDLDNQKNISNLTIPVLIIHGTADAVIPYAQAQQLAKGSAVVKFVTIEGGGHSDLSDFPTYWKSVEEFAELLVKR